MEKKRPKTVAMLREALKAAVCTSQIDRVTGIMAELGPHATRVQARIESSMSPPKLAITVREWHGQEEYGFSFDPKMATMIANALGMSARAIAEAMETTLRRLDEESQFEEMASLVRYLIQQPESGLIRRQQGSDVGRYRPANTWRLNDVDPELAAKWTATCENLIRDAGLQRVRR